MTIYPLSTNAHWFPGNKTTGVTHTLYQSLINNTVNQTNTLSLQNPNTTHTVFLKQIHSANGLAIMDSQTLPFFNISGDFLITNIPNISLSIMTADCLPIIIYDPIHHVIGIAHAGWRGATAGIIPNMLKTMETVYTTNPADCLIRFGPCARQCCYEVSNDFLHIITPEYHTSIITKNNRYYFDLVHYIILQLRIYNGHITPETIAHATCTICNDDYWSYRRSKEHAGRNITTCWLL